MQLSEEEFFSTFSSLFSSPCLFRKDKDKDIEMEENTEQLPTKKRGRPQSSLGKKNQDWKKAKPRSTIASTLSSMSLRQNLQQALESINQAYIGLEEGETKEQINKLKNYTQ